MLAAKCVVVLVSYHPISCFIRALRNSCLIRNTLQTFYFGLFQGTCLNIHETWICIIPLYLPCSSQVEAGDKDATGNPESEREADGGNSKPGGRIFNQKLFQLQKKVSDQDIVSSISSRSCGATPKIVEFCKLSRLPDRSSFTKL